MVQWVNRLQNNIFVNLPPLPLLCEISGALHLAQPGLMAGWWADEIQVNFEIFEVGCRSKYFTQLSVRVTKVQHHYSLTNAFQLVFSCKACCKVDFTVQFFSRGHMISYQFLLLSTIVLNDNHNKNIFLV